MNDEHHTSHFFVEPEFKISRDRDRCWTVTVAGVYYSKQLDRYIVVPVGFETDFASVYSVPGAAFLYAGRAMEAGLIHDYLYRHGHDLGVTRKQADEEFFQAMVATHKAWWIRYPMWWGVRIGGWRHYRKESNEALVDAVNDDLADRLRGHGSDA